MTHPLDGWTITPHALERVAAMGIPPNDVADAVTDPTLAYDGAVGHPPGRRIHVRGNVAVVIDPARRSIVTVLGHRATGRNADGTARYTP